MAHPSRLFTVGLLLFAGTLATATPGADTTAGPSPPEQVDVYTSGSEGYHTYRIPGIVLTGRGTLLAFCEGRKTGRGDHGDLDLVLRRSTDGGRSWGPVQVVYEEGGDAKITIGNPCPVVDRTTGTVWLPFCRDNDDVLITRSTDDGRTWAAPVEITKHVKRPNWTWYATGPGHGIQLTSGRLLIPCDHRDQAARDKGDWKGGGHSHVFFSDDHGRSWKLGGMTEAGMNECEAVQRADGSVLLTMRNYFGRNQRAFAHSTDAGMTWSKPEHHPQVFCPTCQASIHRYGLPPDTNRIFHSGPGGPGRTRLTVRMSPDEGDTWPVAKVLHEGPSAYSDLVVLPDGTIGCLYERGEGHAYEKITFARFGLDWLTDENGAALLESGPFDSPREIGEGPTAELADLRSAAKRERPASFVATSGLPAVRVAYFVPADREPTPGYAERLDRVMTHVREFFQAGMEAAGYGPRTFRLDRDDDGRLRVYLVRGQKPTESYGREDTAAVRPEVKAALAAKEIDVDRSTLVIFEALLVWKDGKALELGPYRGGGNHLSGTAWVYDDERLDPRRLGSKEPGGYYHRPCSIGEFNSHYIGGVAHELGHAFGLPHVRQKKADRKRGTALMGAGNHTYGRELRGEGPGTFLTDASAMLLAQSRPFAGDLDAARRRPSCKTTDLKTQADSGKLVLTGRVATDPPAFGIAAFNDRTDVPNDYDAVGWTCDVDADGRFRLEVGEIRPGRHELRLRVCHAGGTTSRLAFDYEADEQGRPGTDVIHGSLLLDEALDAYAAKDREKAQAVAAEIESQYPDAGTVRRKAEHLSALMLPKTLRSPAEIPADETSAAVSQLTLSEESVGWGRPLRDQVRVEGAGGCLLQVGGTFYESGLYAHAPSRHVLQLGRQWEHFRSGYGLQDGHRGSVVFVVRADGKELFRSETIDDPKLRKTEQDVRGVNVLELIVEDGGNGASGDWGVWITPELMR